MAVLLETTLGDLVIDLYTEERPRACLNFLKLCKIKYYNYCLIYNVQRDFIIQTGDPMGTGRGDMCSHMDSAFYIELFKTSVNLQSRDGSAQPKLINHTVILDDPFDDPPGLSIPDRSPEPTKEQLDSGRIGADEEIDDMKGRSADEIEEVQAEKEAKTRAILLEMVGDLPDAEVKPPENVLFVCKLNPVTTDEDLEIIFSRFGPIKSCEVIRDWKTGESLCYAFIEFEKEEDCEKAYFKMDNVLIDDRRIHVDFSQSVAKIKWKGKGGQYTKDDFKEYEKERDKPSKFALKEKVKPKQDAKYDLVLDDEEEESQTSQSHFAKKQKKKKHYRSEDEEDDKRTKKYKDSDRKHEGERCREKMKSEKKDRHRSRSRSQERSYSKHKDKYREDVRIRDWDKKRDRSRSPKKSKDKERSKYR
uniref:Peptidyl-prolyl cis-trans isomerase n=1 Tax=Pavo cristatus TaxID=9049 RepID=A0A8C9FHU2_PAVCR